MKRALHIILLILLTPVVVFLTLALLLYLPPVQNWAVHTAAGYASEQTGMDISVERVRLRFPLDLSVQGVRAIEPRDSMPQIKDTLIDMREAVVTVELLPLLGSQVEIDRLRLLDTHLNTASLVPEARVKGFVGEISAESHGIDLRAETVMLNKALIDNAQLDIALSDTVPEDTTETETKWRIRVQEAALKRSDITLHLPGDTLQVEARMQSLMAQNADIDLGAKRYEVGHVEMKDGEVLYDNNFAVRQPQGLDVNHMAISEIALTADSIAFQQPLLSLAINELHGREKSGITLEQMHAHVSMDSLRINIPDLYLSTPNSQAKADIRLDLNVMDEHDPGVVVATVDATIGKEDMMMALAQMPQTFRRMWPSEPLTVDGHVEGNMRQVSFDGLNVRLPRVAELTGNGALDNPADIDRMRGNVAVHLKTYDLSIVKTLLDSKTAAMLRLPHMQADAKVNINGKRYDMTLDAREGGKGMLRAKGSVDLRSMAYDLTASMHDLAVHDFVPRFGRMLITADAKAQGTGMQKGRIKASVTTDADHIDGNIDFDALIDKHVLKATATTDLRTADLYRLGVVEAPFDVSFCGHVDVNTDMRQNFKLFATVDDITLKDSATVYRPADVLVDALTRKDTTYAHAFCGDFEIIMHASEGYEALLRSKDNIIDVLDRQLHERVIDQADFRNSLPTMDVMLRCGKENPVYNFCRRMQVNYDEIKARFTTSPTDGINGAAHIYALAAQGYVLDTVNVAIETDSTTIRYNGRVFNTAPNDHVFDARFDGELLEHGLSTNLLFYDDKNRLGVRLGAEAEMVEEGIRLHLTPDRPVLGYMDFALNPDNYVLLRQDQRVLADVQLHADDGTGIQIYSTDDNADTWQDLTLSVAHLNLQRLLSAVPYAPKMTGLMDGDFHVTMDDLNHFSVSCDIGTQKLTFEGANIGNLGCELVYMPKEDGSHYIDGILSKDNMEIATLDGTYNFETEAIDAHVSMDRFPLDMINGNFPDQVVGLGGHADGNLTIGGTSSKPAVNGELMLDSAYMASVPYGVKMRFDNTPVRIVDSRMLLEDFNVYSYNNNPMVLSGYLDFSDTDRILTDLRIRAQNFLLINTKESRKSIAYGKAYVNLYGRAEGLLNDLSVRGRLDVLSSTDMTYVLKDSPLTTDNHLDDLVKFVDFSDTTTTVVNRPPISGVKMDMQLSIAKGVHVLCALNSNHSNYIDLIGGGEMRMQYNNADGIYILGRYELKGGEMKYALPVIPLKTFTIEDGSYVEFTGNPMNPTLNIKATERTKATVADNSGVDRSVDFVCGVEITQTLEKMGLLFVIDAPEDQEISSDLQAMGQAQRGKLAVSMLTTGMYLADGNTSSFSMNNALSSFLSSQIDQITGNALRSIDLSMGLENRTDEFGRQQMDYTFKFSKRLWNNRIKLDIGGRVSSGTDASNQESAFFDNISLEYRLDENASKNLKVYYKAQSYDWLEGRSQEFGAGYVWRKSYQNFWDLFRKSATIVPRTTYRPEQRDTTQQK